MVLGRLLSKYCAEFIELIAFLIAVAFADSPAFVFSHTRTMKSALNLKTGMEGPRKTRKDAKRWSCDFGGIHPTGESINLPKCFFFRVFRVFRGLHRRI